MIEPVLMPDTPTPWILGLSASHNGAACLMHGQQIVAAIQEERLAGKKRARLYGARPSLAVQYCLDLGGITAADLDMVVLCGQESATSAGNDLANNPQLAIKANGTRFASISHHMGHAISAFATSGYAEAAVLVIDGMGSPTPDLSADEQQAILQGTVVGGETNSIYVAEGTRLTALEKHMVDQGRWLNAPPPGAAMPTFGSLGGIFSAAASLIFGNPMDAGKVMGLAPYGTPTIEPEAFFTIRDGQFVFSDQVPKRFTHTDRWPHHQREYEDLAASVQNALEQALLYLAGRVRQLTPSRNLVYAGGVALNSVANERIIREADFNHVYIMPAAEDSGPAIGAAYYGLWQLTGRYAPFRLVRDGFGKEYSDDEIDTAIAQTPAVVTEPCDDPIRRAAEMLDAGRIVAFFSGPSELGPRALGQRSILCDPRRVDAKEILNARVKHREGFRPFAPVIPLEAVADWFEVDGVEPESPFMLRVMRFREDKRDLVPGVVHVDGTGRVQTVTREANGAYYDLVTAFADRTGVPILLNTSLNVMGEPIVETPEEALWCLLLTDMDACIFRRAVAVKDPGCESLADLFPRFLLEPARIQRSPKGESRLFEVATPWGPHKIGVGDPATVTILDLLSNGVMDGATSVSDIFKQLRDHLGDLPDSHLIRLFAQFRRWRLIAFSEKPV